MFSTEQRAADGRPRVRRHRVPRERRRGPVRELEREFGPAGHAKDGATWLRSPASACASEPRPRWSSSAASARRRRVDRRQASARRRSANCAPPARTWVQRLRAPRVARRHALRPDVADSLRLAASRRSASCDPAPRSTSTGRTAGTRRCGGPSQLGPEGVDPRAQGREAARPRRRRVPDRRQVGGGREADRPPALLRLQRRRVRARHVQGPRDDGERPVRRHRGADDRRLRDGERDTASSTSAASTRSRTSACATRSRSAARAGFLGDDVMGEGFRFDIELRRGAGAYICGEETALFNSHRGQARRAAQQAAVPRRARACSASRPASTTSRRC